MDALQAMDMNKFIIIAPTLLVVIYLVTTIQKRLSNSKHANTGLIIPIICFIAATILAFRPLFIVDSEVDGMVAASVIVWLTFNIPTLAFMIPYFAARKNRKTEQYLQNAMTAADADEAADVQPEGASAEQNSQLIR